MAKGAVRSVNIYVNSKDAEKSIDNLEKKIKKETAAWKEMAKGTREYYAKAAEISRMNDALEKENRLIKSNTEKQKERLTQLGLIGAAVSGIVQGLQLLNQGLQKVRDLASDMAGLDDAMGRVRKTTMLSRQEVADLNREFTKIDTRTSREELNELAYAAGKLGVQGKEDVLEFVKAADIINVALGDVLGGTDAIIEVTKLAQVFKDTTREIQNAGLEETLIRTGSVINELGKTSTANEGQIAKFLGRIASYASIAGMSLDQMAGLGSVLSQNSKAPEMSATAVTKIMQQMIKKTGSFADMIGMGEKELSDLMAKDFNQAFLAVLQKLHDIGDVQAIVPIFKDLGADATRASQVILALSTNIDKVRVAQETASKAIKEGTSMNKEYSVMNETLQAQMEKARKTVFDARVELGEKLYPYIVKYTMFGGKVIKWLSRVTDHAENAWMAIAAAGAVAIAKVRKNWDGLRERFSELGPVQEWKGMKAASAELEKKNQEILVSKKRQADLEERLTSMKQTEAKAQANLNDLEAKRATIAQSTNKAVWLTQAQAKQLKDTEAQINNIKAARNALEQRESATAGRQANLKKQLAAEERNILELKKAGRTNDTEMTVALQKKASLETMIAKSEANSLSNNAALTAMKKQQQSLEALKSKLMGSNLSKEERLEAVNAAIEQQERDINRLLNTQQAIRGQINTEVVRQNRLESENKGLKEKAGISSILKNHWMLIATIAAEVLMLIIKIVRESREIERLHKETRNAIAKERTEADLLFNALKRVNTTEEEKARIMEVLNEKYGKYLQNLKDEKGRLVDIEAAHRRVIAAITEEASAKGLQDALDKVTEKNMKNINKYAQKVREMVNMALSGEKQGNGYSNMIAGEAIRQMQDGQSWTTTKRWLESKGIRGNFGGSNAPEYAKYKEGTVVNWDKMNTYSSQIGMWQKTLEKETKKEVAFFESLTKGKTQTVEQLKEDYKTWEKISNENKARKIDNTEAERKIEEIKREAKYSFENALLPEGWESKTYLELQDLLEKAKTETAKIKKEETLWGALTAGGREAQKKISEQIKKIKKETTTGLEPSPQIDDDYDPSSPVASGKNSGKTPEERWADLMKKSAKLNEKAAVESLGISAAKEAVVKTYNAIIAEVESFNETYKGFEERAAAESARLEQEKWDEIARIEDEERAKRLKKIEDNLTSVTEKLNKFRLKQQRKYQTQLETDMEEIENDFGKLRQKAEEERAKLQNRKDAGDTVAAIFGTGGIKNASEEIKELLAKFNITEEVWDEAMRQKPRNAQDLLTLLGLDYNDEDQRKLDAVIESIAELDTAKLAELQALTAERSREIVTAMSDTATRQYREAMKTLEDQILTLEVAQQYLQEHNDGGKNDERLKEIEKTLAFLKGQKSDIQTKYDTGFGKDSWASLFGITEQDWAAWGLNWEDNLAKMTDRLRTFADNAFELWSAIDSVMQNQADAELQRYEETYDAKSEMLKRQLDSGLISQKRYDAQMERMQKEKEKREKKLKHEAFERERMANLIQGAVNLALTISSIYANEPGGVIIKSAAAAVAAGIQAAQLAVIASQPNPYYKGGYIHGRQYAVMGEQGDEWVASNRLLRERETADIIAALDDYQRGNRNALAGISMPPPDLKNVSQSITRNGSNFAPGNQTTNYYYPADNSELLKEMRQMNDFLRDPMNRRAYISSKIQLEFEEQEREVREMARL